MPSVSLVKGQKISLEKQAGAPLKKIIMGLGWDVSDDDYDIDLDASCVMFDKRKNVVDAVYFGQLESKEGSIVHTGDNLTGQGDGDDEQIIVDLSRVPENVKYLVFVVNSYQGDTFDEVDDAFCRIVNQSNNKEIARYNISCQGSYTALIMAKLYREDNEWKMQALGVNCDGEVYDEVIPDMQTIL
ncbi:MAG: TerD family protein [Desulfuromonadaceae bacterium]